MSAEANKKLVRRYFELLSTDDWEAALDVLTVGSPAEVETFREDHRRFRAAFPDYRLTIEEIVAEGDAVALRATVRATHRGEFEGVAPTNKPVTWAEHHMGRIVDGRVEDWNYLGDDLHRLRQLRDGAGTI